MATASTSTSTGEYQDWPVHYTFPPFFTLQPNQETRAKQMVIWIQLIKDYCEKTRTFILDKAHPIFTNSTLPRTLEEEGVTAIFQEMVTKNQGDYVDTSAKDSIYVWWQTRESWASQLLSCANRNGLLNSVATLFELIHDNEEFHGMSETFLVKILRVLESQGKCEVMSSGPGGSVEGVKFFM